MSALQEGGGWSDDEMPAPTISSPSSATHVSRIICMGTLRKSRRFSFSSRASSYICSLSGDVFQYHREKNSKTTLGLRGALDSKSVALSQLQCVHFQYDHTVEEDSMLRNRIIFQYSRVDGSLSASGSMHDDESTSARLGPKRKVSFLMKSKNSFRNRKFTDLTFFETLLSAEKL